MKSYCGVHHERCSGSLVTVNAGWSGAGSGKGSARIHQSSEEAFRCYARELERQGYKRVGAREFESPRGPVLVLDKKSRFGLAMRTGKEGKSGSRLTPRRGKGGVF